MGRELLHVQKVTVFTRLILPQGGTCVCVIYIRITVVTVQAHAPPYGKTSHNIANGRQTVTGIPLVSFCENG